MAHRTQFTKDINLPHRIQQYRLQLQKQIRELRQRQKQCIQQNNQKLLMLQKRMIYGKKKIFSFDRRMNRATLSDQISHYNVEIEGLKHAIAREESARRQEPAQMPQLKLQYVPSRMLLPNMQISSRSGFPNQQPDRIKQPISPSKRIITDPQQQLMTLTHQIIRLKKSLQQVRSKYSDNFTQYKLKQQYQKLQEENKQMTQELKHLEMAKKIVAERQCSRQEVDYDQLESVRAAKEYQIVKKEKEVVGEYLLRLEGQCEEKKTADDRRLREFRETRIEGLVREIEQVSKHNQILTDEINITTQEIERRMQYQRQLRVRLPA